jgi:ATP-binding cassette subfamily F protein 3
LALAKLMLDGANLLLLDEPTNHLDIPARKSLEQALASYQGTIIFVSHDRRLIADLATGLWLIEDGKVKSFDGTFAEYLESTAATPPGGPAMPAPQPRRPAVASPKRRDGRAIAALESAIDAREQELAALAQSINDASARSDSEAVGTLGLRFEALQSELRGLMEQWEDIAG